MEQPTRENMELPTREDITQLMQHNPDGGVCISIYLPSNPMPQEAQQTALRLKNILRDLENQLLENELRRPDVEALLAPIVELVEDEGFWQTQAGGLAIFRAPDLTEVMRLPFSVEELVMVNARFHLKPLLPALAKGKNADFYVLALSQNSVRLLHATPFNIQEVTPEHIPTSMDEALSEDDPQRELQFHSAVGGASGGGAIFHGHDPADDHKQNVLRFFHVVDRGITQFLGGRNTPLILAGVDYLIPLYKQTNEYPHLLEEAIFGSPDRLSANELHQQALPIIEKQWADFRQQLVERYANRVATEQTSDQLDEILLAATMGRIDTLMVAADGQQWGKYDAENNAVEIHDPVEPDDEDLLDLAAMQTMLMGGEVYVFEQDDLPSEAPVAALYRY